ncbi:hypothetical protein FRC0190_00372 [Corynebacterium rouxii]|uniref:Uncharacterized protein n=1 Tax=Corynebacterium rouxii TaxID=2719119 RepID=A0A6I8MDR0_9CORY|nr:hypothetical protein FRC0190_00372 [Corynebacterium rouxii]
MSNWNKIAWVLITVIAVIIGIRYIVMGLALI